MKENLPEVHHVFENTTRIWHLARSVAEYMFMFEIELKSEKDEGAVEDFMTCVLETISPHGQ